MPAAREIIQSGPDNCLIIPDQVAISFIEGDGVGPDIWKTSVEVFNAADGLFTKPSNISIPNSLPLSEEEIDGQEPHS